jgi:hypothetical protein
MAERFFEKPTLEVLGHRFTRFSLGEIRINMTVLEVQVKDACSFFL